MTNGIRPPTVAGLLLVLAIVVLGGCGRAPQKIAIGVAVTAPSRTGLELAVQEINAAGGVGGVPVELVGPHWQPGADAEEVLRWAERFAESDEVMAVIGHSDSASTLSAAAVYNQYEMPQLVTIATHPAITEIGAWTYRLCLSDAQQGPILARYAVESWGKRRIAVIYVNDDYGRGLAELFERRVQSLGGEILVSVFHRNDLLEDDRGLLRDRLAELVALDPELIFLIQRVEAADWTVRAIREAGLTADILGADNLSRPAFLEADPELKEGIRVSQFFQLQPEDARGIDFLETFRDYAGRDPDYGSAFAYDAVHLIREALLEGGFTRAAVKAYADRLIEEGTAVSGVAGRFRLASNHDAIRSLYIAEIRDGSFEPLVEIQ